MHDGNVGLILDVAGIIQLAHGTAHSAEMIAADANESLDDIDEL